MIQALTALYVIIAIILFFVFLDGISFFRKAITRAVFWPILLIKELVLGIYEEFTE